MGGVTSRSLRRKINRAKRRSRHPSGSLEVFPDLPRPIRLVLDSAQLLHRYLRAAQGDAAGAAAAAFADAVTAVRRVVDLAQPYDAFDVLESVRLSQTPHDPESYRETEDEHSGAVIELCALVLAGRAKRAGALPDENGHRPRADGVIDEIVQQCSTAVALGSIVSFLRMATTPGKIASAQLGAVLREMFVHNLSYEHMLVDTLRDLFDDPSVAQACRSALGFTVAEIRAVFTALITLHEQAWQRRFDALSELGALAQSESAGGVAMPGAYEISPDTRERGVALWTQAWSDPADASTFSSDAVAAEAGVDPRVTDRILGLFSYSLEARDPADATRQFFEGRSPFRTTPILREPGGSSVVVHGGLLVPAIRAQVEQTLKGSAGWDRYAKHRGDYLEREALRLLDGVFPGCTVYQAFEYFVPDPAAAPPEIAPEQYTHRVEGDGLLVIDDVALILEAKAGALTDASRAGSAMRLGSDLRKIVTTAAGQAERTRLRIQQDGGLRLGDGSWLDLGHVREMHSIAVSLEDLSGIATVTSELVTAGLLTTAHLPWTVSIHDLRVITELVERPGELLLYLRRRTEPDVTRRFQAIDELDFFLEFFATGLYVEPDPDRVRAELPQFGEPSVAAKRRFKRQGPTFLTSRTDPLDAWYFYQLGVRSTPAPKPRFNRDPDLSTLVDTLAAQQGQGWLRVGTTLFEASGPVQRKFAHYASQLVDMTRRDRLPHTATVAGGTRADQSYVLVWASRAPRESVEEATRHLRTYVSAKKHQLQAALGAGLLFDPLDPASPCATYYDNRPPGADVPLDRAVARLGLRPIQRTSIAIPGHGKQRRRRARA